jgi:hypothetical protein
LIMVSAHFGSALRSLGLSTKQMTRGLRTRNCGDPPLNL